MPKQIAVAVVVAFIVCGCKHDPQTLTIGQLNDFGNALAQQLKSAIEEERRNSWPSQHEITISLTSTDIKKTDSVIHPIIGAIVLRMTDTIKWHDQPEIQIDTISITASRTDGVWVIASATDKEDSDFDPIGRESQTSPTGERDISSWSALTEAVAAAQTPPAH